MIVRGLSSPNGAKNTLFTSSMLARLVRYESKCTINRRLGVWRQEVWIPTILVPQTRLSRRHQSTGGFSSNTFGLAFSVSPEAARQKFLRWARTEQGLPSFLLGDSGVRLSAWYCPVWNFDLNIRYIVTDPETGKKRFDWKPDLFSVYGTQSVIHVPGLSAYAGYGYRRSLIDPLHNTSLVFLGDKVVPFGSWMLQDMKLASGERLPVFPDPWNATKSFALSVVKETLHSLPSEPEKQIQVQTQLLSARRVYMPTYVIEYKLLGLQ